MANPSFHPVEKPQNPRQISSGRLSEDSRHLWLEEHDACAIVASVRKTGEATHGNLKRALAALGIMGHRSGDVNGEGDGCGVLTDIPRRLWAEALEREGKPAWLAEDRRFFVGHLMIPNTMNAELTQIKAQILNMIADTGSDLLLERPGITRPQALGKIAHAQAPFFWQVAGLMRNGPLENVEHCLFDLALSIERKTAVHVASLSSYSVVYKVRGTIETLYQYYPELRSPDYTTAITIGHARYSTNTTTAFERVQPFHLLGHNGEINTIARLREQALMLGVQLVPGGSDSQDLDRTLASLIHYYGLTLVEAIELLFPPILSEVEKVTPELHELFMTIFAGHLVLLLKGRLRLFHVMGMNVRLALMRLDYAHYGLARPKKNIFSPQKKGYITWIRCDAILVRSHQEKR